MGVWTALALVAAALGVAVFLRGFWVKWADVTLSEQENRIGGTACHPKVDR